MFLEQLFEPRNRNIESIEPVIFLRVFQSRLGLYPVGVLKNRDWRRIIDREYGSLKLLCFLIIYEPFLLEQERCLRCGITRKLAINISYSGE
jgi:hypothetical protein